MLEGLFSGIRVVTDPYGIAHHCAPGLQHQSGLKALLPSVFTKLCSLSLKLFYIPPLYHRDR